MPQNRKLSNILVGLLRVFDQKGQTEEGFASKIYLTDLFENTDIILSTATREIII